MKKTELETFENGKIIHLHGQFTGGEETDELEQLLAEIKDEGKDSTMSEGVVTIARHMARERFGADLHLSGQVLVKHKRQRSKS